MSLSINAISGSLAASHQVQRTYASLMNTMTQLSTGSRINSAKDDPAGLIFQFWDLKTLAFRRYNVCYG